MKQIYWSIPHSLPIIRKIYSPILQIQYLKTVTIKGIIIVFGGHKFIKILLIAILSIIFGVFSAVCIKKRKFSWKILVLGIVMFFGGLSLNYILGSDRIPLRLVFSHISE